MTTLVPFVLFFVISKVLGGHEWYIAAAIAALLVPALRIGYMKGEWKVFLLGAGLGLFIEAVLDVVYQTQYWIDASLYTVPVWLPLVWGGGFVLIRRFTDMMVAKHRT